MLIVDVIVKVIVPDETEISFIENTIKKALCTAIQFVSVEVDELSTEVYGDTAP